MLWAIRSECTGKSLKIPCIFPSNLHGEPIVSSPEDALHTFEAHTFEDDSFEDSGLPHPAPERYLISKLDTEESGNHLIVPSHPAE